MIATFKGIRMCKPKLLVEDNPSTSFLVQIFISIFGFHMLSRKYALLKLEIYAVLAQNFGKEMALNLLNEFENCIPKNEVTLICWMGMQIQIHEQSFIFAVVLT